MISRMFVAQGAIIAALLTTAMPAFADHDRPVSSAGTVSVGVVSATTCTYKGCDTPKDSVQPEVIVLEDGSKIYIY